MIQSFNQYATVMLTNNNVVDLWTESLDFAIRFGDGSWHGTTAKLLIPARMTPMCGPTMAARLCDPRDLAHFPLLRSYRAQDWPTWFETAGIDDIVAGGPIFDASHLMAIAAARGTGVALLPYLMFAHEKASGILVQPFDISVDRGSYWLTHLASRSPSDGAQVFADWLAETTASER